MKRIFYICNTGKNVNFKNKQNLGLLSFDILAQSKFEAHRTIRKSTSNRRLNYHKIQGTKGEEWIRMARRKYSSKMLIIQNTSNR